MSVGRWKLGVRADSRSTQRLLEKVFAGYLTDEGEPLRSNFSVRRDRVGLFKREWVLYIGGVAALRSAKPDLVIHALASYLSGLRAERADGTRVGTRMFALGRRAVLVDAPRPQLVDNAIFGDTSIMEVPVWEPTVIARARSVEGPGALDLVSWEAGRLATPAPYEDVYDLVGLVLQQPDGRPDANLKQIWDTSSQPDETWLDLLSVMHLDGEVSVGMSEQAIADAIGQLLRR